MSTDTADRVATLALDDPKITVREIADKCGVSRQRVHQILKTRGINAARANLTYRPARVRKPPPRPVPRVVPSDGAVSVSHTVTGSISELLAATDLMARGMVVFFPLVRKGRCDIVALTADHKRALRIEVRSGKRVGKKNKTIMFSKKPSDACDHYAVVLYDEPVMYFPPLPTSQ